MATETVSEANNKPTHAHEGAASGDRKSARKSKASVSSNGRTSKRHINGAGLNHTAGRLAGALALGGLTSGAAGGFSDQLTELKDKGLKTAQAAERRIVQHPKSSVLIAFGAGYLWARLRRWI